MEELPEYQICTKCGKRSTPYMEKCWNCGESFFADPNAGVDDFKPENQDMESKEFTEPEKISPCTLEKMSFTDKMFAYSLLFRGEMVLEFCGCTICSKAYKDTLAFFRETAPDSEEIIKEAEETEIKGIILDISQLGL